MGQAVKAYERLAQRFERMAVLGEASSMLGWDASVMMPAGGSAARGDQFAVLASLSHEMLIAPAVADDLAEAQSSPLEDLAGGAQAIGFFHGLRSPHRGGGLDPRTGAGAVAGFAALAL